MDKEEKILQSVEKFLRWHILPVVLFLIFLGCKYNLATLLDLGFLIYGCGIFFYILNFAYFFIKNIYKKKIEE